MNIATVRILAVDDEAAYRKLVKQVLEKAGYSVDVAANGQEAYEMFGRTHYDLVLMDVMMPEMDGIELCQRIRGMSEVPIVMFTALSQEDRVVAGLRAGADDYIAKPFGVAEFIARIEAVLRRAHITQGPTAPLRTGALVIDIERGTVTSGGQLINLTATEQRLFMYMARHLGRVLTYSQLLSGGWGADYTHETQIVHVTISRLRNKLEPVPSAPRHILTRVGIGYILAALPPDRANRNL